MAIGALGAIGPLPALADSQTPARTQPLPGADPRMTPPTPAVSLVGGQPFVVYVSDPSTGAGTIMVGEQAIPFTNSAIVQSLHQAIA
ncbi:MAG: hypothetical protein JO057_19260 [Chloroflexi bacterium]|nr:hypothetical protein [Chloroflexota bacterium]